VYFGKPDPTLIKYLGFLVPWDIIWLDVIPGDIFPSGPGSV